MPDMNIKVLHKGDAGPAFDVGEYLEASENWRVCIIEGGMASGKPAIALALEVPLGDGTAFTVTAQTSLGLLIGLVAAARGAFPEEFIGTPFEVREDGVHIRSFPYVEQG